MAASESPTTALQINFHVSVCVDADASGPVLESFGRTFAAFAPFRKAGWQFVRTSPPQQQLSARRVKGENLFVRMDGTFTECVHRRVDKRDDYDKLESLFDCTKDALWSKNFLNTCGENKLVIINWGLYAANRPIDDSSRLARWTLSINTRPIATTTHDLEVQLQNNLFGKMGQLDSAHDACGLGASLGCIESWLWQQKVAFGLLNDAMDALEAADTDNAREPSVNTKELIHNAITAIQTLDKSLINLVALIDARVGRYPAAKGRWKLVTALRALIRGSLSVVAIDDADLEEHKKQARRQLANLQHLQPVLRLHIRLHDQETRANFRKAYSKAAPDSEKREMMERLSATPDHVKTKQTRAEMMKVMRESFSDNYNRLVAEVEAVNKLIGAEYCRRGQKVFKVRPRPGNGLGGTRLAGTVKNPQRPCRLHSRESDDSSEWSVEEWDEKGKA